MKKIYAALILTVLLMGMAGCDGAAPAKIDTAKTDTSKAPETTKEVNPVKEEAKAPAVTVSYKAGDTVAAEWMKGSWYLATIKAEKEGKYDVDYADGTSGTVTADQLKPLDKNFKPAVGDKVNAVWAADGRFYPGTIDAVEADGVKVKWDDGSSVSSVKFGKIYK